MQCDRNLLSTSQTLRTSLNKANSVAFDCLHIKQAPSNFSRSSRDMMGCIITSSGSKSAAFHIKCRFVQDVAHSQVDWPARVKMRSLQFANN